MFFFSFESRTSTVRATMISDNNTLLEEVYDPLYENLDSHSSIESDHNAPSNSDAYAMGKRKVTLRTKKILVDQPSHVRYRILLGKLNPERMRINTRTRCQGRPR